MVREIRMLDTLSITSQLGENAQLLTKTDNWLETQRILLSEQFSQLCSELNTLQKVQQIKRQMHQTNSVAVRCTELLNNQPIDDVIYIMSLPDAIQAARKELDSKKQINRWAADGHDIETAKKLRKD